MSDDSELSYTNSRKSISVQSRKESIQPPAGTSNPSSPEIEIGLAYDRNQSILIFEIGKGINFGMSSTGRAPGNKKYSFYTLII